jgi:predicted neuraminidase
MNRSLLLLTLLLASAGLTPAAESPRFQAELVFPLDRRHNHAPGIVECPNGDLLVSWYRGSGERKADDVAVYGAWLAKNGTRWSEPFLLADTPGFPDCNTALFVDDRRRLWLFYPTILANTWESCLTNFKVASQFKRPGSPKWDREGLILLKPADFSERGRQLLAAELEEHKLVLNDKLREEIQLARERMGDKLYQRLGWQPRCKPTQLPSGRLVLPLYTDTFSISIMAISDDHGQTWHASQPLLGFGNIQPAVLRRTDGTLIAYMRENGPRKKVRVAESKDDGESWGDVGVCEMPNPGSGLDGLRLANGHWVLVYNDTTTGRQRLAVSLSTDEGLTWSHTRHLENQPQGAYHDPASTQGKNGAVHVVYSYFVEQGKSMKHAAFNEAWITAGDRP